ncbi:MAG: hypothetical protein ACLTYN_14360 [Dysosmobacter welbionis]
MGKTENSTPYSPRYGEAETGGTGRLKIFFGYAAGVGKTAMLEAAHQAQKEGVDVVVGYMEPTPGRIHWRCWKGWRSSHAGGGLPGDPAAGV